MISTPDQGLSHLFGESHVSVTEPSSHVEHDLEMSVYFDCGDGEITSLLGRCDGHLDCISGADEKSCHSDSNSSRLILLLQNELFRYLTQTGR